MGSSKSMACKKDVLLKRQAIQVAGLLPDDPDEAIIVLNYAREIIESLFGARQAPAASANLEDLRRLIPIRRPRQSSGHGDGAG